MSSTLRQRMRDLSLEALRAGIHNSDEMRDYISQKLQQPNDSQFTNTHAWALVDLQASGKVLKRGHRDYVLALGAGSAVSDLVPEPTESFFPAWARKKVLEANQRNGPAGPRFTPADLIALWKQCGGKCEVTRQEFSFAPVDDNSFVKHAYAPSLDRLKPGQPYTRENCRLVMVAVNIGMNSWGLDVYLKVARAAVASAPA